MTGMSNCYGIAAQELRLSWWPKHSAPSLPASTFQSPPTLFLSLLPHYYGVPLQVRLSGPRRAWYWPIRPDLALRSRALLLDLVRLIPSVGVLVRNPFGERMVPDLTASFSELWNHTVPSVSFNPFPSPPAMPLTKCRRHSDEVRYEASRHLRGPST
jgi:hypothetical protein